MTRKGGYFFIIFGSYFVLMAIVGSLMFFNRGSSPNPEYMANKPKSFKEREPIKEAIYKINKEGALDSLNVHDNILLYAIAHLNDEVDYIGSKFQAEARLIRDEISKITSAVWTLVIGILLGIATNYLVKGLDWLGSSDRGN